MKTRKPKKPKTIADLKINWTFEIRKMFEGTYEFTRLNPELIDYRIKTNQNYTFLIDDKSFVFDSFQYYGPEDNVSIDSFVEAISWKMRIATGKTGFKLDHFELISENTFRIHTRPL